MDRMLRRMRILAITVIYMFCGTKGDVTIGHAVIEDGLQYGIYCMKKFETECNINHEQSMRNAKQKTAAYLHDIFINGPPTSDFDHNIHDAIRGVFASKKLCERTKMSAEKLKDIEDVIIEWRNKFGAGNNIRPYCSDIDHVRRRIDGACNNLRHPEWGMSSQPQPRWLKPEYDDGIESPRSRGINGLPLPNPREISNKVFQSETGTDDKADIERTILVMHYGQLLDHDLSLTPVLMCPGGATIDCCNSKENRMECLPIHVPKDDMFFTTQKCINFVRSEPANLPYPYHREQLNKLTSYVDCSFVYGSTKKAEKELRQFKEGLLKVSDHMLLPKGKDSQCREGNGKCTLAGDNRVNVATGLTTLHTLFVRYHNMLASQLRQINPRWNDERLYQEVRKLVIAIFQHVTYNEYLHVILGSSIMDTYGLRSTGHFHYQDHLDASIRNAFSTAAFRFGHSQIPSITKYIFPDHETTQPLEDTLMRPTFVNKQKGTFIVHIGRWMTRTTSPPVDREFSGSIRNTLFKDSKGKSLDLVSLNIQRGRDHGLPPYNKWREFCGLSKARDFSTYGGLEDHSAENAYLLESLYKNVEDIDLFAGGISERHVHGAAMGPTFACIVARQFHNLKYGDRFWYEKDGLFTPEQLNSIKRMRMSKILCQTTGLETLQPWVLEPINCRNNVLTLCHKLPTIDLSLFRDPRAQVEYCRPPYDFFRQYSAKQRNLYHS